MDKQKEIEALQEKLSVLEGFIGHRGWDEWFAPKIGVKLKDTLKLLLSDVGDAQKRADFWRGQTNILNWLPQEAVADLQTLRNKLKDLTRPEEELIDPETGEKLLPPPI